MVEYQEKKRKRIIDQHNQITEKQDQKQRVAISQDQTSKQPYSK